MQLQHLCGNIMISGLFGGSSVVMMQSLHVQSCFLMSSHVSLCWDDLHEPQELRTTKSRLKTYLNYYWCLKWKIIGGVGGK